jgi:hypothetical protein
MMLSKIIDTTVRAVVYEAAGPIAPEAFAVGVAGLERMGALNEIPFAVIEGDPSDVSAWVPAVRQAIDRLTRLRYDECR